MFCTLQVQYDTVNQPQRNKSFVIFCNHFSERLSKLTTYLVPSEHIHFHLGRVD
jgi:hypothetical protein